MKLTDYLGDKPFWNVTVKLAVPVALQNVLTSSFQLVDTMMVSRLGDVTLSAVGMASQWGWLSSLLCFGLCSGMSVFISQYWGIRDYKGIRRVTGQGLIIALLLTLSFLSVALAAPEWVRFGDGIMIDHRIHIAAHDEKAQPRLAEDTDRVRVLPVRLGDDADLIARVLQHARNDRMAEGRVVDVAVADDIDEITLLPAAPVHIRAGDR